ncbi:hypothetical protein [Neolewinella persica]|uniref:hypothetical protein n=1 Tax=Neolewinella persica TaxID=70998 RepID=UPI000366EFC5|nr:hypothetical protein [Neolewinella persica]
MFKYITPLLILLLASLSSFAQDAKPAPNRAADPTQAYPITNRPQNPALQEFDASFPGENVGFLHVYVDPDIAPDEVYLMRGTPISSTTKALLPAKFQRMADKMNAKLYGSMAVKGIDESLYILRMEGQTSGRVEMFAIRGNKIKHLKTLAYRKCLNGKCDQLDSYLTNLNADTNLELIQISRTMRRSGETAMKRHAFLLNDRNRKWKKSKQLDVPWTSVRFFDPRLDDQ